MVQRYSARNASNGEITVARKAGTKAATSADNPSARTACQRYDGIVWIRAVELVAQESPCGKRQWQPDQESKKYRPQCTSQDELDDVQPVGAQRHTHADLVGATCGVVGGHTVQPNRSEDKRKNPEERSQARDEALLGELTGTCSLSVRIEMIGIPGSTEAMAWRIRRNRTDLAPGLVRMTMSRRKSEPEIGLRRSPLVLPAERTRGDWAARGSLAR